MQNDSQSDPQPTVVNSESTPTSPAPLSVYPEPVTSPGDQIQVGVSASQMGLSQSIGKNKITPRKLITICVVILVVLGGILTGLIFTNIIVFSRFKVIDYTNLSGSRYSLAYYTKHTTKTLKSGNTELVSKVSEGNKYPIVLSIANGDSSGYAKARNCSGFTKVFDVQNNNLNQIISVCNFSLGLNSPNSVYIAGFQVGSQTSIVTISQDLSGVDLSSQTGAQQSLLKFGLGPYQDDIKQIIASIKIR